MEYALKRYRQSVDEFEKHMTHCEVSPWRLRDVISAHDYSLEMFRHFVWNNAENNLYAGRYGGRESNFKTEMDGLHERTLRIFANCVKNE